MRAAAARTCRHEDAAAGTAAKTSNTAIGTSTATAKAGAVIVPSPSAGTAASTAKTEAAPASIDTTAVEPACAPARRVTARRNAPSAAAMRCALCASAPYAARTSRLAR